VGYFLGDKGATLVSRISNYREWGATLLIIGLTAAMGGMVLLARAGRERAAKQQSKKVPQELLVAAAADLKFAMEEMVQKFQRDSPEISVEVTYGSSGNFYSQLVNQAPFDIYFSADVGYPRKLSEQGLALEGSDFVYAVGRIVIWAPIFSPIDVERLGTESLRHSSVRHIAIANPKHAPYGKAAEAAMRSLGLYEAVREKLVYGENVAQAFQFIQSGAAELGIIALSLALAPNARDQGRYREIPQQAYPRLEQGGVILKWARDPTAARSFRSFVLGSTGREILKRYGFTLPGE
jgi:molybdate transport system substrate-binding protein